VPREPVVSGLTVTNILTFAVVLALPVLAVPALIRGSVHRTLLEAAVVGLLVFALLAALGAVTLRTDRLLSWIGRTAQRIRNRLRRGSPPLEDLPARLLAQRDRILATLGPRWHRALLATVSRWGFDYLSLVAALAAVHDEPRPAVLLLAFCAAGGTACAVQVERRSQRRCWCSWGS
jgi:uncharacterized membrane protein YbhN (UPF0104 family)